ncbi:hypothetical protein ACT80S_12195 [Ramlibacter sp. MAHUQ-53]|uniref:hypothetical protein n=1 Tax=unclassified Ramlibacter TaxID=2617605 RepID=UPI00364147C9
MIASVESALQAARPQPIFLEGKLPVLEAPAAASLGLHDGQVVRPAVEARGDNLFLILQGHAIDVPAHLRLAAGERPAWIVRLDPGGRATLVPVGDGGAAAAASSANAAAAAPAAGGTAGRLEQLALRPPTLSALATLMQPGVLQAMAQAAPQGEVGAWVAKLVRQWPALSQLTGETLRRMMRQGGWTQEAALARGEAEAEAGLGLDTKTLLRILLAQWTDAPATTRRLLGDALDEVESHQLQLAVDAQAGRDASLTMLLPFADAEPVDVRWAREGAADADAEGRRAPWVVHLHTRSSHFGEVWMRTRITSGDGGAGGAAGAVDLTMWAERAELAARARAGAGSLAAWLNEAGLRMTGLHVFHGAPPAPAPEPGPEGGDPGRLVDVRA